MAYRGLIIAIEDYSQATGGLVATKLPGTLQAGKEFKKWLEQKWRAEGRPLAETEIVFCSDPVLPDGRRATRNDVLGALDELRRKPQNTTDELYVFFSGHGFAFDQGFGDRADIIICSDFEDAAMSGHCCLNLDEIILWLRWHLGPGRQYYFVDACRNPLDASQVAPGSLLPKGPKGSSEPSTFVLQSTTPGNIAPVGGPFPAMLLSGLHGKGKAKTWDPQVNDRMFVNYESLQSYVATKVAPLKPTSTVRGTEGARDAIIATIRPVPTSKCTVKVNKASKTDEGELQVRRGRAPFETHAIKGQHTILSFEPDDYAFRLKLKNGAVAPDGLVPVDLYEDNEIEFQKIQPPPGGIPPFAPPTPSPTPPPLRPEAIDAEVTFTIPSQGKVKLRNLETGDINMATGFDTLTLPPGRYAASVRDAADRVLGRRELGLRPSDSVNISLSEWSQGAGFKSIASRLPDLGGFPAFSETLGNTIIDADLDVWLALLGGGRILGPRDYSKLVRFPLHDFGTERPGTAPIYVLGGFDDSDTELHIAVSKDKKVIWKAARQPTGMAGIREMYMQVKTPGPQLVSFQVGNGSPYTIASLASRNRAMLITVTVADQGLNIGQYLLPIGGLMNELAQRVGQYVRQTSLKDILFLARAARTFRQRKDLRSQLKHHELEDLLYKKWLDPIACSMAAYEFIRRGKQRDLKMVVENMQKYFADLPDTAALAILSGDRSAKEPTGVPLFADGLQAFPDYERWLPLAANHLDFTSPWTAWRSAVATQNRGRN